MNLSLQSLFRQVDLCLQQQVMTSGVGLNYLYKAMIDTLLKFEEDPKDTQLQSQLFFKDTAGYMDSNVSDGGNLGLIQRDALTNKGQYIDMEGPIYFDVCQQDRLLINGIQTDVNFVLLGQNSTHIKRKNS